MLFMVGNCSPYAPSKSQEADMARGSVCMSLFRPRSPPSIRREKSPKKGSTVFPSSALGDDGKCVKLKEVRLCDSLSLIPSYLSRCSVWAACCGLRCSMPKCIVSHQRQGSQHNNLRSRE